MTVRRGHQNFPKLIDTRTIKLGEPLYWQCFCPGFGRHASGGDEGTRTPDPLRARQVLYQLSYIPW